ncbi:12/13S [Guinea pig adenovirus 1]|uniref:12/13S n=1 Tax=Guinea pig adenovirus 1 TaxID=2847100 RepID=A0AC61M029_9ADEN|nr:12/13S [Guinea pig adenovirus]QIZ64144.1 12/13S [Guinea pig adenovirus 1]
MARIVSTGVWWPPVDVHSSFCVCDPNVCPTAAAARARRGSERQAAAAAAAAEKGKRNLSAAHRGEGSEPVSVLRWEAPSGEVSLGDGLETAGTHVCGWDYETPGACSCFEGREMTEEDLLCFENLYGMEDGGGLSTDDDGGYLRVEEEDFELDYPESPGADCKSCEWHRRRGMQVLCSLCYMRLSEWIGGEYVRGERVYRGKWGSRK